MARTKYPTISLEKLSDMSPQEIGAQDSKLLFHTYQKLRDTALKRLKRLEKAGYSDTNVYREYRDDISVKPSTMTDEEIKKGLIELRAFLSNEQTKVSWQKNNKENKEKMREIVFNKKWLDTLSDAELELFGDFMDTLRANSAYFLDYDDKALNELWSLYKQNPNVTDFKNDPIMRKAYEKFTAREDTVLLSKPVRNSARKTQSTRDSEQRRLRTIFKRKRAKVIYNKNKDGFTVNKKRGKVKIKDRKGK